MVETTVLLNGRFFTGETKYSEPRSLIIQEGLVAGIYPRDEFPITFDEPVKRIDLEGQVVWPGLTDSHLHLQALADQLTAIDCETSTYDACLTQVKEACFSKPGNTWIKGYGWNQNAWQPAKYGTALELDKITGAHPVVLYAKSLHASWVNTEALKIARISADTPNPLGGLILRDLDGRPNGILIDNAMELVDRIIPAPSNAEMESMLGSLQQQLLSLGITAVHDFDRMSCFLGLQSLETSGKLLLRVQKNLPGELLEELASSEIRSGFGSDHLYTGHLKFFADGALGPQSAAMLDPYIGSHQKGILLMDANAVLEQGIRAAELGWPLAIHAIGDAANREVLDGFMKLRAYEASQNLPHHKHRIEHVQLIHPDDHKRLRELDIIASVQPIHATSDMFTADRHWGERSMYAYPFKSLNQFARVIFGSDAPVESADPFLGLHAAVTRRRITGEPGPQGWYPEQRLSLRAAVDAYTINPAICSTKEIKTGRIAPGFKADLIVLPCDPFAIDPQDICRIHPQMTMIAGKIVHQC